MLISGIKSLVGCGCRMSGAYDRSKYLRRNHGLLVQAFYCWRQFSITSRQRRQRALRAQQWYEREHLMRHVLLGWFRVAMQQHRVTVNNKYIADVEAAKRDIAAQHAGQIDDLRYVGVGGQGGEMTTLQKRGHSF